MSEPIDTAPGDPDAVELVERFPDPDAYIALRSAVGLSRKTPEAARRGLANTLYGVSLVHRAGDGAATLVGMGRVIGDDGCFYLVVDIAVARAWQGRGLGKRIMAALDAWIRRTAPPSAHVSLFADGDAKHLYAQYGFVETRESVGMTYTIRAP